MGYVGACGGFALQIEGIGQNGVAHQHPVVSHQHGGAGRHCQKMPGTAGGDALGGVRIKFRHPHQPVLQLRVRIHIIQRFFLFRPGHVPEIQVGLHGNKAKVFHFACFRVQGVQFYAADFAVQRAGDQKLVFPVGGKGHGADLYAAVPECPDCGIPLPPDRTPAGDSERHRNRDRPDNNSKADNSR